MSYIEKLITSLQTSLDDILLKNINVSYEESVHPLAKKLLEELLKIPIENWPRKNILSSIDIYIETLAIYIQYLYSKNQDIKIPYHCLMNVLIKHPYFINVYHSNKTIDEWNEFRIKLLDELPPNTSQYDNIKSILNADTNSNTILQKIKFFVNTTYTTVSVPLSKYSDKPYILIHASNGLKRLNSIVIYNHIDKLKYKLLDINTLKLLRPFVIPKEIIQSTDPVTDKATSNNNIPISLLLSYDDDESTVTLLGEYSSHSEILRILNGAIQQIVPIKELDLSIKEDFYKLQSNERLDIKIVRAEYTKLKQIATQIYHRSTKETFSNNLLNESHLHEVIPSQELIYFKIYLSPISKFLTYSLIDIIDYVTAYIYPDLLTATI